MSALIAAAGSGERLGLGPKAFVRVGGATLLEHAYEALSAVCNEVVVAVPAGKSGEARELLGAGPMILEGRESRQATVLAMLERASFPLVVVHDAARPFLPRYVLTEVIAAAAASGAASAALRVVDSVVDAMSGETIDRERLRLVQTPQAFSTALLLRAHLAALENGISATDDAALVRLLGERVSLTQGSELLNKVTTADHMLWAAAMVGVWRRGLENGSGE